MMVAMDNFFSVRSRLPKSSKISFQRRKRRSEKFSGGQGGGEVPVHLELLCTSTASEVDSLQKYCTSTSIQAQRFDCGMQSIEPVESGPSRIKAAVVPRRSNNAARRKATRLIRPGDLVILFIVSNVEIFVCV